MGALFIILDAEYKSLIEFRASVEPTGNARRVPKTNPILPQPDLVEIFALRKSRA
jgi:hypothetical protein